MNRSISTALSLSVIIVLIVSCVCRADNLTIAAGGQSGYVIYVDRGASDAVQTAAQELSDDIYASTGARLPVVSSKPWSAPAIYVGWGAGAARAFPKAEPDHLAAEGFVIAPFRRNILITGRDDRGTLYGVYSFLERQLDVGWYGPDATVIPKHARIEVASTEIIEAPKFAMRDCEAGVVRKSAAWDAHIRLNGPDVPAEPEHGGNFPLFNGAENFYELVPPDKYFAAHPEYYSLIDGVRATSTGKDAEPGQLCLTNPDVFRIIVDALADEAEKNPNELVFGLSPNDSGDGNCTDSACRASDALYGAPSGTLLSFVNRVAAAMQSRFPNRKVWLETLAYQYNEKAPIPGTITPASNVLVCLCPIYACVAHPMAHDSDSAAARQALEAWSNVASGHLQVWQYATNFANYLQPLPDFDELGPDIAFYHQHGVSGVFVEADYQNGSGDLEPMRTWLLGKLLWNPNQQVRPLIKQFCNGYFGPASPEMYAYVNLLHSPFTDPKVHMHIYDAPNAAYFPAPLLRQADALFEDADRAAADPVIRRRVDRMQIGLRYVELMQKRPADTAAEPDRDAWNTQYSAFIADVKKFDITYISEGRSIDAGR